MARRLCAAALTCLLTWSVPSGARAQQTAAQAAAAAAAAATPAPTPATPAAPAQTAPAPAKPEVDEEPPLPDDPQPAPNAGPPPPPGAAPATRPPPPPPDDPSYYPGPPSPPGERDLEHATYYQRCFGVPHGGYGPIGVYGEVPISGGGRGGGGRGDGSGGSVPNLGSSDDKAWLVLAVVAVAALPVVIYTIDDPAERIVLERFSCPTFSFQWTGGVESSKDLLGNTAQGVSTGRLTFGYSHFATEFQFDGSSGSTSGFAARLQLRVTPKQHVEGGLSLGYRRAVFGSLSQDGFEVGLPHEYTLWRDGLRTVGLEVRPMLLFTGGGVEPTLETWLRFPLLEVLHARVGGRAYTFSGALFWGAQFGLDLTL